MDFSSSSSNSQYRSSSAFAAASTGRPSSSSDLPIHDTASQFPPTESPNKHEISFSMQETGRFASDYGYGYNYGGGGASTAGRDTGMPEKTEEGVDRQSEEEREHMFDKVVTPSDVGKLNRLVIPKQHAEKYFPLDSSSSEKGLLLDFEDRSGKLWRFRYSYWNSSQSYVMTKGWSRFVKEKKLDAGDVVSFQRGKERFYIDWRRRPGAPHPPPPPYHHHHHHQFPQNFSFHRSNPFLLAGQQPPLMLHHQTPRDHRQLPISIGTYPNTYRGSAISYTGLGIAANSSGYNEVITSPNYANCCNQQQGSAVSMRGEPPHHHQIQMQMELSRSMTTNKTTSSPRGGAASDEPMVLESVPVVPGAGKRLRLFGVNMNCILDQDSEAPADIDPTSSPEEADGSLQLRLSGSGTNTPSSSSIQTASDFLDKGKSSMTLDFDF